MKITHIVLAICFILPFFVEFCYSTEQVVVEFLYFDPSQLENFCPTCPEGWVKWREYMDAESLIDSIQEEYGDKVIIERVDKTTAEGQERCDQYGCTAAQTIVVNHTSKLEGKQITEENLKEVIDEYLTGGQPGENPFQSQPLTILGAFSLGFFDTFSPCLIAMMSFILSYTIGKTNVFKESMVRVIAFGIGFVAAAVLLGAAVALTLFFTPSIYAVLLWIVCIFAIIFGLNLLGLLNVPIRTKPLVRKLAAKYATTYVGLLALGFVFYFLDPCIAPFAFTMLVMLQNLEFILPLLAFCLGAIIPFIGVGLLAGYVSKLARSTYKHRSEIRAISGLVLIVYALYLIILYLF